jgi:hypothetical protein
VNPPKLFSIHKLNFWLNIVAITPNGVSDASSVPAIRKTGVKTDFTTIFSSIYSFESHKRPTRDLNERDTITPPPLFAETFGPINAANNADGVSKIPTITSMCEYDKFVFFNSIWALSC